MQKVTREKHLDHMVKVVPFIVGCYFFQCYVIMNTGPGKFASVSLSILGGFLALMIAMFITYDLKHQVTIFEDYLEISFLGKTQTLRFCDIISMSINEPGQSFSTLTLKTTGKRYRFHFIDDAEKLKALIEEKNLYFKQAA